MRCPYCSAEFAASATHCPSCGRIRDLPDAPTSRIVLLAVLGLVLIGVVGFLGFRESRASSNVVWVNPPPRASRLPVDHGAVVSVSELEGLGKLYFVPTGRQAIPVADLVAYYREKFDLTITELPAIKPLPGACDEQRSQCAAEELIFGMIRAYPKIAADPASVMIAVTDEDIYSAAEGTNFNYSYHFGRQFGVVSSYRASLSGDQPTAPEVRKLAGTKQIFTKYIGYMYYHLPYSHDPTSILHQPFTPNGGSDNLYESDLHSEFSANGYWGNDSPCFGIRYSYKTGIIAPIETSVFQCTDMHKLVNSVEDETFQTEIMGGVLVERAMDLQVASLPAIEFRRGYLTRYPYNQAFGMGATVNYNKWGISDGIDKMDYVDLLHEDATREHYNRISPGRGFSPNVEWLGANDIDVYKAHMTWDKNHFHVAYYDGSSSTILPCTASSECYWSGFQDAQGHALVINRGPKRELMGVTASDGMKVDCKTDDQRRIVFAKDSAGHAVSYEYDQKGNLAKVHRADGQVALYGYDKDHNMTTFSVIRRPGTAPKLMLTNEYDDFGRIAKQTIAGGKTCSIRYTYPVTSSQYHSVVTDFSGQELDISPNGLDDGYIAKAETVKYRALSNR